MVAGGFLCTVFIDAYLLLSDNIFMNFKNVIASSFALLGVAASVFGFTSIINSVEAPAPVSASGSGSDSSEASATAVCANSSDTFAQDDSQVLASEYAKGGTAECLFVGCGGII